MSNTSNFLLSKWYLDCVAEDGTTFIGYAATVKWKLVALHFASILTRRPNANTHTKTSLLSEALPQQDESGIRWTPHSFNMEAEWNGLSRAIERQLYAGEDGEVTWRCLLPMARARVTIWNLPPIEGLGYVEHLTLSIPPWRLPIAELRWGRFLTGKDSLVWIDWKGAILKTLVFHNGEEVGIPVITDFEVRGDNGLRLSLVQNAIVRNGPLLSTTLATIPGITRIFPTDILQMHECKWLSRGEMLSRDLLAVSGWALHELVRFG